MKIIHFVIVSCCWASFLLVWKQWDVLIVMWVRNLLLSSLCSCLDVSISWHPSSILKLCSFPRLQNSIGTKGLWTQHCVVPVGCQRLHNIGLQGCVYTSVCVCAWWTIFSVSDVTVYTLHCDLSVISVLIVIQLFHYNMLKLYLTQFTLVKYKLHLLSIRICSFLQNFF